MLRESAMWANPVSSSVDSIPPAGNHPSVPANVISRIMPSQPSGIEYRVERAEERARVEGAAPAPRSLDADQDPEER